MKPICKILIIILIILYSSIIPVFAEEPEWMDPQEKTMRMTESFTREGYVIEATDFYDYSALITVFDAKGNFVTRNITRIDDYFVVQDRVNITIIDLQEVRGNIGANLGLNVSVDQWVKIRTRVKGSPSIKLSIIPKGIEINNKTIAMHTFIPGSEIPVNFSIRNEGKARLKDMILKINTSLPVLYEEKLNYEILELGAGNESGPITVRFQAPYTRERKSISISAEAIGYDIYRKAYRAADSANIEVVPPFDNRIDLVKHVSEKVYMGDMAVVSISIRNNGSQEFDNVNLTDSLPPGIEPIDTNLSWNFSLGPFEQKTKSYMVKPQKPGTYLFLPGSSIIEYQGILDYNKKSIKLIVGGPYVVLLKSASSYDPVKGEIINITIEAKNLGDATAIVKLIDTIPVNYTLTSDDQTYENISDTMVLHPGKSESFSYLLSTSATGRFILPPARATILDKIMYKDERYTQSASSAELSIKVREPLKMELSSSKMTSIPKKSIRPDSIVTNVPYETPKSSSGFEGYIFILLFILIYVIKKINFRN
jgi:uncharacterized repeat protein (TIGR01451 family)